jgi:hypothetical protein
LPTAKADVGEAASVIAVEPFVYPDAIALNEVHESALVGI